MTTTTPATTSPAMAKRGSATRWSLAGTKALVTGGSHGIGYAVVEELAALGAAVHTCSRNQAELNQVLKQWSAKGFAVTGSVCDVTSRSQREQLIEKISSQFGGKLDILVNNVGICIAKPTTEYTVEDHSITMATNFDSPYHICQLSHPLLKASGSGSIVFISSVAGLVNVMYASLYGATKGAMTQLTKNLACEWAKDNIRTNCIAPWVIKTRQAQHVLDNKELLDHVLSTTPLKRPGEPDEVSSLVAFLCLLLLTLLARRLLLMEDLQLTVSKFNLSFCVILEEFSFKRSYECNKLLY